MNEILILIFLTAIINYREKPVGQRVKVYDDAPLNTGRGSAQ